MYALALSKERGFNPHSIKPLPSDWSVYWIIFGFLSKMGEERSRHQIIGLLQRLESVVHPKDPRVTDVL